MTDIQRDALVRVFKAMNDCWGLFPDEPLPRNDDMCAWHQLSDAIAKEVVLSLAKERQR